jgi:hypothetical protein
MGIFLFNHHAQTEYEARPASFPMGTRGSIPGGKAAEGVKMATNLHLAPSSRMRGAMPPLPKMPSWHDAQLKHKDFTFFNTKSLDLLFNEKLRDLYTSSDMFHINEIKNNTK